MPGRLDVALPHVAVEEPGGRDVSGLEQPDQRRQPREALRVGIGATDEREDLELPLEVRAVVGEHVHEVVLREVRRVRRPGFRGARSRGSRTSPTRAAERFRREAPRTQSIAPRARGRARAGSNGAGASRAGRARRSLVAGVADVLDEAVALEIHPRQPVRALRVPARDAHEVVLHAERLGVLRDPVRDDGRDRPQHELAEHHVMDDPLAVGQVAPGQHVGELVGPERLERPVVDRDAGERARDRLEQVGLHVGEAGLRRHGRRDPPCDERHFLDVVVVDTGSVSRVQRNESLSIARAERRRIRRRPPSRDRSGHGRSHRAVWNGSTVGTRLEESAMHAVIGRVKIKPGNADETRAMITVQASPWSVAWWGLSGRLLVAEPRASGDLIQHSFWLFDTEENVRTAEATFNTLREMPEAPATFVSVEVSEIIGQA